VGGQQLGHRGQAEQDPSRAVLARVGPAHRDHVGFVLGRHGGRQAIEERVVVQRLGLHPDGGALGLEGPHRGPGGSGPFLVTPPGEPDRGSPVPATAAPDGQGPQGEPPGRRQDTRRSGAAHSVLAPPARGCFLTRFRAVRNSAGRIGSHGCPLPRRCGRTGTENRAAVIRTERSTTVQFEHHTQRGSRESKYRNRVFHARGGYRTGCHPGRHPGRIGRHGRQPRDGRRHVARGTGAEGQRREDHRRDRGHRASAGPGTGGRTTTENFIAEADAVHLTSLGLNCLRVPFSRPQLRTRRRSIRDPPRRIAKARTGGRPVCGSRHLHGPGPPRRPGHQNQHWRSDNPTHEAFFWEHRHFQDRVVHLWQALANTSGTTPGWPGTTCSTDPPIPPDRSSDRSTTVW
jgi:hypothetical protein